MITREQLARHFAEWLYDGAIFIEQLEDHDEPAHAVNLRAALDALFEIFAIEVGRSDLQQAMRDHLAAFDRAAEAGRS